MSRSRKKHPVYKDNSSGYKEVHNRRFRRINRQRVKQGLRPKLMNEIRCKWDICDWRTYVDKETIDWWKFRGWSEEKIKEYLDKAYRK